MTEAERLTQRGNVFRNLSRPAEALACYEQALQWQPDHLEALKNRGNALRALNRPEQALASYRLALQFKPDYAEALNNCGVVLQELNRPGEALPYYEQALLHKPACVGTLINRGVALHDLNQLEAALASYQLAIRLEPASAEAQFGASLCRLLLGDFISGWQAYEWRWKVPAFAALRRAFTQPLWLGDAPLHGKTILLHAEQGLGDTLQFCRYAQAVAELGASVWLEVPASLQALLTQLPGIKGVVVRGQALPPFDYHCPLLSLPLALRTELATIPAQAAYLRADTGKIAGWSQRLAVHGRPLIGLVWSGSLAHVKDRHRSIPLAELSSVLNTGARFVSVQKEVPESDRAAFGQAGLIDVAGGLHDFTDTAALLACLDHVITVDTSVAHLAGALGRPTTLLLAHRPDFRWLLGRDDTPWYPSLRLVRQDRPGDWSAAIAQVARWLRENR
jgi:tetratricopeptide (TPR) repeat protein